MALQKSRPVTIPATAVHRQFGDLVRRVYSGEEHFIVEKDGLPVAAILSIAEYEELMKERQAREERLSQFRQAARAVGEALERRGLSEEEVLAELDREREQIYRERYGNDAAS